MRIKKNGRFWLGVAIIVIGMVLLGVPMGIISGESGDGINLFETKPLLMIISFTLLFAGLGLLIFGAVTATLGFINKSVCKVFINDSLVKDVGAIDIKKRVSSCLDKNAVAVNLLKNGYVLSKQNCYYKISKNVALIFMLESGIENGLDLETDIKDMFAQIKKECFFLSATVFQLDIKDVVSEADILELSYAITKAPFLKDGSVFFCQAYLDLTSQLFYCDSKVFERFINGAVCGFATKKMIDDMSGKSKNASLAQISENGATMEKNNYKLSTDKIYLVYILMAILGVVIALMAVVAFLDKEVAAIGILIFGLVSTFGFLFFGLLIKRGVVISKSAVTEKRFSQKPFVINSNQATWKVKGCLKNGVIVPVIVITDNFVFEKNELALDKNAKGKYIIVKCNDSNKRILEKTIGEESKI